ncbi:7060_t:CDS:10 [Dentiscutata erythropus]|uniref:Peroxisomal ATPase PEX6 n=1 Tax=Dentiscutata erythropus TaxID=1348616 RepID=A0A9N8V790_9GLOM|nr:7060_t:CDS:10 [Dentiscutata erythropus]
MKKIIVVKKQIFDNDFTIGLSENLWNELIREDYYDYSQAAICISINQTDLDKKNPLLKKKSLANSSVIAYGKCYYPEHHELIFSDNVCYISSKFAKQNNFVNGAEVDVINVRPVELDEVIIGALDHESYEILLRDTSTIFNWFRLSPPIIIRYGQIYRLNNLPISLDSDSYFGFKILMCGPVLQGIVMDHTNFIITDISKDYYLNDYEDDEFDEVTTEYAIENELLDQDILDLKDDYMTTQLALLEADGQDELDGDESDYISSVTSSDDESWNNVVPLPTKSKFTPVILSTPFPSKLLQPAPKEKEDPESRILISLKELAKLGFQSGSWALVSGPKIEKSRMCKVYAVDIPMSATDSLPPVYVTPMLHFNLGFGEMTASDECIFIQPTKRTQLPPPVTRSIYVARVASPSSTDRSIHTASINGLKNWFEEADRIVCEGDIITIPTDEEAARLRPQKIEGDIETLEDMDIATSPINPGTVVYFKISEMKRKNSKICLKYGYGMRVDHNCTEMVQTGMVHSRVPFVKQYLNYNTSSRLDLSPFLTSPETPYAQLFNLISSCLHPSALLLNLSCTVLLHGPRGCGKKTAVEWVAERVGVHVYEVNCFDFAGETDTKTETSLRSRLDKAVTCSPCVLLLRHIDALARKSAVLETGQEPTISIILQESFKQLIENFQTIGYPVLVVGTTGDIDKVPSSVIGCFRHEIIFEAPSETIRLEILKQLTCETPVAPDVSLSSLATQTAALVANDLVDLVARAGLAALERVENVMKKTKQSLRDIDLVRAGIALTAVDFDDALGKARASYSDSIGAPKIPNVTWDDVGGLASVKDNILDTIQLPLEHPELFATGMKKRSGILLYGPPGTGKTLLAKAVATSCSLNFFSVKGPELLNMYIGESEANVRRVFQRARDAKPCVIFFDELDSVAPKRGEKGDSGGVMDRIVSQLLAELDGMGQSSGTADVFVIGATNRPDLLDPALLRPGRFDKLLYLGVSEDHETQLNIIQALTRKFRLHPSLDLRAVAEKCPFNYTGADFYALCSDAMLKAMSRTAKAVEDKVSQLNSNPTPNLPQPVTSQYYLNHIATSEDTLVEVTQEDFEKALQELIPSVSEKELEHYRMVQMRFTQQEDVQTEHLPVV